MQRLSRYLVLAGLLAAALVLGGCGDSAPKPLAEADPIASGDSCHVCGMTITNHPGPKGEAFMGRNEAPLKFCSTAELFTFLRQPENEAQLSHAYVHDMGATGWESPDDDAFIRADEAVYVVGHDRRGSMGHTLAPFADNSAAEAFIEDHGGQIVAFDDITLERLANLGTSGMKH
ncbi:nitrous oxide reductase accessory protein NosL [Halomonas piscis]|uniref:Nitrous oxide reductase accessory protein NosL n=1 Tax=Halomonas piscis TaxID=3031727 RepID=A0ABY9YXC7_9GAMM|nr:nitrous oxide reductase accessory protein NosL [Halomonas piscis]WNK19539.1 nitrous oxide reductase accessory protein NosL [Halomonas piscis]